MKLTLIPKRPSVTEVFKHEPPALDVTGSLFLNKISNTVSPIVYTFLTAFLLKGIKIKRCVCWF